MESSNNGENVPEIRKRVVRNRLFRNALHDVTKNAPSENNCSNSLEADEVNCGKAENSGNEKKELITKDKPVCRGVQSSPDHKNHKQFPDHSYKPYQSYQTDYSRSNVGRQLQNRDPLPSKEHRNSYQAYKTEPKGYNSDKGSYGFQGKNLRRSYSGGEDYSVLSNQKNERYENVDQTYRTKSKSDHLKQYRERRSFNGNDKFLGNRDNEKWESYVKGNRMDSNNYREKRSYMKEEAPNLYDHFAEKLPSCDKESDTELTNHKYTKEDNNDQHFVKASEKTTLDNHETVSTESYCEFTGINHNRKVSKVNGEVLVSVQNDGQPLASVPTLNESSNLELDEGSKKSLINKSADIEQDVNIQNIFLLDEENFIPPPVQPSLDDTVLCLHSKNSDSTNETSSTNESEIDYSSLPEPDSDHLEAVTQFIRGIVKEKSVPNDLAHRVMEELNRIFKCHLEGNVVGLYGSYYSDLAITTSDINFVMEADTVVKKRFMQEVHKVLYSELEKYSMHPFEEGISTSRTKILFSEPVSGICCQLVCLGRHQSEVCEMGKFLKKVCCYDSKVKTLIIAVKVWAETCLINEFEEGKLHPVGFALMMVHFLQQNEPPILPIFSHQDDKTELSPLHCNASEGELWIAFLRYYTLKFDWKHHVVTVYSKECVSKKSKGWETYWIAIEDPFSRKNIADSVVNSDVADYIRACFKASFVYFLNPPENGIITSPQEDSLSNENICNKWQYSFQLCTVDNNDAFCDACEELDDICEDCKKKVYVPPMRALPEMSDAFLKQIKKALNLVFDKYMLTEEEINERQMFVYKLQENVQKIYPEAELKLFGSSTNGFGFKHSDLDICMTFKGQQKVDPTPVLKNLRALLRREKDFECVYAIFNAQIPIIKFHYRSKGWRGDISLNNVLAVHNSDLLHCYSKIDERCRILGCALKLLSKKALIAEVTDKALSSYSYLVMVIHFLQQTDPPVLPVLQDRKLHNGSHDLSDIVEGWNVWFCKDLDYVEKVCRDTYGTKNETPVEQLWLDLLDFYCSYESNRFITIRQKEPLLLKENQYSARLFNIQDPFIETKNLGCVVSAKKAQESENVFRRARCLFRTPVKEFHSSVKDDEDYFFSTMSLTGKIQKEAHCNLCGKFGHEDSDCKQSYFPNKRNHFRQFPSRNLFRNRHMKNKQMNRSLQR